MEAISRGGTSFVQGFDLMAVHLCNSRIKVANTCRELVIVLCKAN
jgi:hypothetical protein